MKRQILVPVTPSDVSRKIIMLADQWANLVGAEIHFLHVVDVNLNSSLPKLLREDSVQKDQQALQSFLDNQSLTADYSASAHLGRTSEVILREERQGNYEFILMAAHSHKIVSRLLLGSVSDAILHASTGSVCFYKESPTEIEDAIIVPLDYSDANEQVVKLADIYGQLTGGKLLFIHVVPPLPKPFFSFQGPKEHAESTNRESTVESRTDSRYPEEIKKMTAYLERQSIKSDYEQFVEFGKPYRKIVELCENSAAALIMMATHSYTDKSRILPGSITKAVLHQSKTSVFVFKAGLHPVYISRPS